MIESKCVRCGSQLRWNEFAYEQEVCWECVLKHVFTILNNIDICSMFWKHKEEDQELIMWLTEIAAAHYKVRRPAFGKGE